MTEYQIIIVAAGTTSSAWEQHATWDADGRSALQSALQILGDTGSSAPTIAEAIVEQAFTGEKRRFRVAIEEAV